MAYVVMSNKPSVSVSLHVTSNTTITVPGSYGVSNLSAPGETLTGAYIAQVHWSCPPGQYLRITRNGFVVGIFDSSSYIDFAGCGMPITKAANKNITFEFIGPGNGYCIVEMQKVFTPITTLDPEPDASAWDPSVLLAGGTLGVWYDTTDLSTMYQDTGGTTVINAAGQLVARINPKAGTWAQLQQATMAAQPIVQLDSNSRYCVSFDSVDDKMGTSAFPQMTSTDEVTVIAAIKFRTSTQAPDVFCVGGVSSPGSYGIIRGTATQNIFTSINRGSITTATLPTTTGIYSGAQNLVVSTMGKISSDYSEIFVNGVSGGVGSGDMGTGGWRTNLNATIGRAFNQSIDGTVYGLFAINRLLTPSEHTQAVNYFKNLMGI